MKCPKCGFEQIDAAAPECAKCGILFAKWSAREQQRQQQADQQLADFAELESFDVCERSGAAHAPAVVPPFQPDFEAASGGGLAPGLGSVFIRVGSLACVLGTLSFALNLIGFEFILLMPLEAFDNPTAAKLWTIGGGVGLAIVGGVLGGAVDDD